MNENRKCENGYNPIKNIAYIPELHLVKVNGVFFPYEHLTKIVKELFPGKEVQQDIIKVVTVLYNKYKDKVAIENFFIPAGVWNVKQRLYEIGLYRCLSMFSWKSRYGGGKMNPVSLEAVELYKKIYKNFLKAWKMDKVVKIGKECSTWNNSFTLLASFHPYIVQYAKHPVLYIGAQFEMWQGKTLPVPLPVHLLPDWKAVQRVKRLFVLMRQAGILQVKEFWQVPEVKAYITNYLSDDPHKLYLVRWW